MSNKKLTQLPAQTVLNPTDLLYVVDPTRPDEEASRSVTISTLESLVEGPTGPTGPQGPTGATGPQGPTGPAESKVSLGRTIDDFSSPVLLDSDDAGKLLIVDASSDEEVGIGLGQLTVGDVITLVQWDEGVIEIVEEDDTKQTLIGKPKTAGEGTALQVICLEDTTDAEVYLLLGGDE